MTNCLKPHPSHSVDILGEKSYALVDGLGGEHELTFTRSASVESLLLYNNSTSNFGGKHVSGNLGNRVFSWTPLIESNYGVSKGAFDELVSDNKVLLEFVFRAVAKSNTLGYIDFDFVPSDNGQVVGVCAGIFSGRSVKSFFDAICILRKSCRVLPGIMVVYKPILIMALVFWLHMTQMKFLMSQRVLFLLDLM